MKTTTRSKSHESGQILVVVVFLLVALIGMVGLVADGGQLYSSRRHAQNAADNAALAGAYAICNEADAVSAAQAVAVQNGYSDADPDVSVVVDNPPQSGAHAGQDGYVEVNINAQEQPGFIQVLYSGPWEVAARAVAKCTQNSPAPLGQGNGLIVLNPTASGALSANGQPILSVIGGIYVDSNHATAMTVGNASFSASEGIAIVGSSPGYTKGPQGSVSPPPVTGAPSLIDPLLTLADPTRPAGACINSDTTSGEVRTINPGVYCRITVTSGGVLTMNPGLYYVEGGEVLVQSDGTVTGLGVLIYSTAGPITLIGGGSVNLTPPDSGDYKGLVIFTSRTNTSVITIIGGGATTVVGTLYSPAGTLSLAGSGCSDSSLSLDTQVIVNILQLSGNACINIEYDSSLGYNPDKGSKVLGLTD
ncbi:MAG TPA: pilus assembly protein TadG-related protein [Anaerolineales bacterium]|nr:pilus assembly protein TadG-related protein [Anaerolineales bacterium]